MNFAALRNLPVGRKLAYAFGIICILCALLGVYTFVTFRSIIASSTDVRDNTLPSVVILAKISNSVNNIRRSDLALVSCKTSDCTEWYMNIRDKNIASYNSALKLYAEKKSYPGEKELYESFSNGYTQYIATSTQAGELVKSGDATAAAAMLGAAEVSKNFVSSMEQLSADQDLNEKFGKQESSDSVMFSRRAVWISTSIILAVFLVCISTGVVLTKLIVPPLAEATEALERVASKDLGVHVDVVGTDEIGRLGIALNKSVETMCGVVSSVAQSSETLSAAAAELSVRAVQTNGNTQVQSSKTNQIAAAAQEMTATIAEISRNAGSASEASRQSASLATEGGSVMAEAAETMSRIDNATSSVAQKMNSLAERSQEIGNVVTVIQEISEQTNLLALNAAIEAARAGEHGRGFAVVSGEVRRLAERTKAATEEIAGTIRRIQEETRDTLQLMEGSSTAVKVGLEETGRARKSLDGIIESSQRVEQMVEMIATAATEQTAASGEISQSATQISNLAMENSHAAEETAEATKNLSELASDLDRTVRQFERCGEDNQPGGRLKSHTQTSTARQFQRAS